MTFIRKQLIYSLFYTLTIFLFIFSITFLYQNGRLDWQSLISNRMFGIPLYAFYLLVLLMGAILFSWMNGQRIAQVSRSIEHSLAEITQGKLQHGVNELTDSEFIGIKEELKKIEKQWQEQVKASQRIANEKAEEQEKHIQKMIVEERNRLARELHDSVSQQLFAASMLMSAVTEGLGENDTEARKKQLFMVEQMIQQSQLEMRALLLHLRPIALKGKTLYEGMEELLLELSQKVPMKLEWKIEPILLEKGIEDHLFRILQESLSNTLRHSKATVVKVLLIHREGRIIMRIEDDGKGFNVTEEQEKAGSYGLKNMHERAIEVGGSLKLISVKGQGTKLEVKVPIVEGV